MKDKLLTIITVLLIGVLLVILQSCKKDDTALTAEEIFTKKISQTWKVLRVTVDDIDVTTAFRTMIVSFKTDHSFTVSNAVEPIWPASGSFEVVAVSDSDFDIKRNDGVAIDVTSLTDASVFLELLYTQSTGRAKEVSGKYKFELTR